MGELVMRLSAAGTLPRPQPRPAVRISRKKGCSGVRYRVREDRDLQPNDESTFNRKFPN